MSCVLSEVSSSALVGRAKNQGVVLALSLSIVVLFKNVISDV